MRKKDFEKFYEGLTVDQQRFFDKYELERDREVSRYKEMMLYVIGTTAGVVIGAIVGKAIGK